MSTLYISSDNLVSLDALTSLTTHIVVSNATVVGTLYDLNGTLITTFNLTSIDSDGNYSGTLPNTVALISTLYILQVVATSTEGILTLRTTVKAEYANANTSCCN